MGWRCIGCDNQIGWDGQGSFSYTCQCGGHIFYNDESGELAPPSSLVMAVHKKTDLPHLDYLVGKSSFTSPRKEGIIKELLSLGAIWMKDCEQCREDGTYQSVLDREKAEAVFEAERILENQKESK